jgi:methylmalonyl-CoA mutase cobalamin-binding domain/chain
LKSDEIVNLVKSQLKSGADPSEVLKALAVGMDKVGKLFEKNDYYLTELVLAGEMMKEVLKVLAPKLKSEQLGSKQKVICATVSGDYHDIGKNILKILLISAGFEVIDLGADCSKEKIIKAAKKYGVKVIALSSLMIMTVKEISDVNIALKEAGLRDQVRLIVGGAPLNMQLAKELGADDFAADAVEGVRHIKALMGA